MNTNAEQTIVAIPSSVPGGYEAYISPHFGQCDVFTLITVTQKGIGHMNVVPNLPHEHGGCMAPVRLLADHHVNVMIACGLGRRPLQGLATAGIDVFHCVQARTVDEAILDFCAGRLPRYDINRACGDHAHSEP